MTCCELQSVCLNADFHPDAISDEQLVDIYCHGVCCKDCQEFIAASQLGRGHAVREGPEERLERLQKNPVYHRRFMEATANAAKMGSTETHFLPKLCKEVRAFALKVYQLSEEMDSWPEEKQKKFKAALVTAGNHCLNCPDCREWSIGRKDEFENSKDPEILKAKADAEEFGKKLMQDQKFADAIRKKGEYDA